MGFGGFWDRPEDPGRPIGFILEAQEVPKSSPKPEKIDVEKQHIFGIDF